MKSTVIVLVSMSWFSTAHVVIAAARPATVLLVTSDDLADAWTEYSDWKTRQGMPTKVITVSTLADRYAGDDLQQRIRAGVLDHIEQHGTRWVVLGGDSQPGGKGHVPDRDTRHRNFNYTDIPTDLYYLSPSDFDANHDGVYGDWSDDRESIQYTHAAAVIGRIPVRTTADVAAYTKKVIDFESDYPRNACCRQMVYTCPEPSAYPKLTTSKSAVSDAWSDGQLSQFFANRTPWDVDAPGDHGLSPQNWLAMLNNRKAGKLHMHGHGLLPVWVLEKRQTINQATVNQLHNRKAYPVMTTVSCFTGHYDAEQDPSITEAMLRRPGAGAIAVIAPSRQGVPVFANRSDFRKMITEGKMDGTTQLLTDFWTIGLKRNLTLGEAFAAARVRMAPQAAKHPGYHWCLCELNLLGDPTLSMRANPPSIPTLQHPQTIAVGEQTIAVESNAMGAKVCLWKGAEVYQVLTVDGDGTARFDIAPRTPGTIRVAISGVDLNTVTSEITVSD